MILEKLKDTHTHTGRKGKQQREREREKKAHSVGRHTNIHT